MNDKSKEMLLTHILYEMQMYLWSYQEEKEYNVGDPRKNSAWITHKVCLRNLLGFFDMQQTNSFDTDIKYDKFSFSNKVKTKKFSCIGCRQKLKKEFIDLKIDKKKRRGIGLDKLIDKSIVHLTEARFCKHKKEENTLDNFLIEQTYKVYPIMCSNIRNFIKLLETEKSIIYKVNSKKKINISKELENDNILELIKNISNLLSFKKRNDDLVSCCASAPSCSWPIE